MSLDTPLPDDPRAAPDAGLDLHEPEESAPRFTLLWQAISLLIVFLVGGVGGYVLRGYQAQQRIAARQAEEQAALQQAEAERAELLQQINPPEGYALPVHYGDLGPQLLEAGAIDYEQFLAVYERSGRPLSDEQKDILRKGSDARIVINSENAYFLLNFFWALGLTNENRILTEGPMVQYSEGQIERFASTGGWTIGALPVTQIYASAALIPLTPQQQARLEEVASAVYRPCCNNPTSFPDCNHGMAMLGMLELMASQGATTDEMFEAAKYANAFWFPQQTLEIATYYKNAQGLDFSQVEARQVVGSNFSSGSGFRAVHQWLLQNGLLEQAPGGGGSCGV